MYMTSKEKNNEALRKETEIGSTETVNMTTKR
jgi:hypothetical protein